MLVVAITGAVGTAGVNLPLYLRSNKGATGVIGCVEGLRWSTELLGVTGFGGIELARLAYSGVDGGLEL